MRGLTLPTTKNGFVGSDLVCEQQSALGSDQDFSAIMNAARHTMPRLLVIDDDNLHRMIICRVAAKAGFLPAGAASYDEAAKLAQETAFDCITLDLSLGHHARSEIPD